MADNVYIPAGRTSMVRRGDLQLQVQTEYAYRPYPRVTTTVLNNGQVLHKIEKKLDTPVDSEETHIRTQRLIQQQHADVTSILESESSLMPPTEPRPQPRPAADTAPPRSLTERVAAIGGVQRLYRLDNNGNFAGDGSSDEFRSAFAPVLKHIPDLVNIFAELRGPGERREQGVYEIYRDKLYMISTGKEFFFVVVKRVDRATNFEQSLRDAIRDEVPLP